MSPLGPGKGDRSVSELFEPVLSDPTTPLLNALKEARKGVLFQIGTQPGDYSSLTDGHEFKNKIGNYYAE